MNAALLSIVLIVGPATQPSPAPTVNTFPNYSITESCATAPNRAACRQIETAARDALAARWPSLPPAKKAQCKAAGASVPGGSCVAAESCATR
jgi:hypothetical protein